MRKKPESARGKGRDPQQFAWWSRTSVIAVRVRSDAPPAARHQRRATSGLNTVLHTWFLDSDGVLIHGSLIPFASSRIASYVSRLFSV